jgi:Ca-activated chloride channel homolog
MEKKSFGTKQFTGFEDRFQYFLAAGLFLLLIEFSISERRSKIIQKMDLFNETKKKSV